MSTTLRLPYLITAAVSGLLFGAGLYVSQMVDPYKVLNFLNFGAIPTGGWDPSLAFVMGGGALVMFIAVRYSRGRTAPLFDANFHEPEFNRIDTPLVAGAALFGLGSYGGLGDTLAGLAWGAEDLSADLGSATSRDDLGQLTGPYALARNLMLAGAVVRDDPVSPGSGPPGT